MALNAVATMAQVIGASYWVGIAYADPDAELRVRLEYWSALGCPSFLVRFRRFVQNGRRLGSNNCY